VTAEVVRSFIVGEAGRRSIGSVKNVVTALRALLRFLHVRGYVAISLAGAVPAVAGWRTGLFPHVLQAAEVAGLLECCDRRTVGGRRDYAILVLLARLGLRAGEVAALSVDDIDWRAGEILVCGKGNRYERLPLPVDVGKAPG
jgi:integrase